jgi:hypothetical protein
VTPHRPIGDHVTMTDAGMTDAAAPTTAPTRRRIGASLNRAEKLGITLLVVSVAEDALRKRRAAIRYATAKARYTAMMRVNEGTNTTAFVGGLLLSGALTGWVRPRRRSGR